MSLIHQLTLPRHFQPIFAPKIYITQNHPATATRSMSQTMPEPPALQKPPGYRDVNNPTVRPTIPKPPQLRPLRPPLKPAIRRRARHRRCCRRIYCWICTILVTLLFLAAITCALAYLWFQPRFPVYRFTSLKPLHLNVSFSDQDSNVFNCSVVFKVQALNPNGKMDVYYGDSEAHFAVVDEDGDIDVGSATEVGFVQGRRNATTLGFAANASGVVVDDAVGRRLMRRIKRKEIRFSVEVKTSVGVRVAGKSTGRLPIRVVCPAVSLRLAGAGGGFSRNCGITLFRWIDLH